MVSMTRSRPRLVWLMTLVWNIFSIKILMLIGLSDPTSMARSHTPNSDESLILLICSRHRCAVRDGVAMVM